MAHESQHGVEGAGGAVEDRPANRLIDSTSPYLLQHAHNPVDWYPWGPEAIDKARREGKPIFLSIGYSACHWCHVMERECFENPQIAAIMNAHFVNIKVDREERPDLDELYMLATQVMTGSGGWPMSVWLTPELEPFYAGTYFPPIDSTGRHGFPRVELALADAWKNQQAELRSHAQEVVERVRQYADETARTAGSTASGGGGGAARAGERPAVDVDAWVTAAIEQFADRFDPDNGGLGSAPKFPPSQGLLLWLAMLKHPQRLSKEQLAVLREMTTKTLDAMMRGGMYDHVGGGFARYSVDASWHVPHFEKMLYDNAQLAPVYALAAVQFGRPDYARVARQTLDFYLREMVCPQGGFYSTLDADSEGVEGKYYVWTLEEIREAIPNADDATVLIEHLGIKAEGNWEEGGPGLNVLRVERTADDLAKQYGVSTEAMQKRIDTMLRKLREARDKRVRPGLDDKVLTGWNGLMISALAICGRLLREPRYLEAAHRAIGFLLIHHMDGGRRLLRVSRNLGREGGRAHTDAFLEDHAFLLNGLMDIIEATSPTSLPGTMARKRALELADTMVRSFADRERGGFFFTAGAHDKLFARLKHATDGAMPSANAMAVRALLRLAENSGKVEYRDVAMEAAGAFAGAVARAPSLFPTLLHGLYCDTQFLASNPRLGLGSPDEVEVGLPPDESAIGEPIVARPETEQRILRLDPVRLPTLHPGQTFDLSLTLHVAEGYHIQAAKPRDREAFATVARVRGDLPIAMTEWQYPPTSEIDGLPGYGGTVTITGRITVQHNAASGSYALRAIVLAQPCAGTSCLPPEKVAIDIPVKVTQ